MNDITKFLNGIFFGFIQIFDSKIFIFISNSI
jgi:hypothetical protein